MDFSYGPTKNRAFKYAIKWEVMMENMSAFGENHGSVLNGKSDNCT